jgi:hypothetical protein
MQPSYDFGCLVYLLKLLTNTKFLIQLTSKNITPTYDLPIMLDPDTMPHQFATRPTQILILDWYA